MEIMNKFEFEASKEIAKAKVDEKAKALLPLTEGTDEYGEAAKNVALAMFDYGRYLAANKLGKKYIVPKCPSKSYINLIRKVFS